MKEPHYLLEQPRIPRCSAPGMNGREYTRCGGGRILNQKNSPGSAREYPAPSRAGIDGRTVLSLSIFFGVFFLPLFALAQKLPNPAPGAGATLQDFVYLLIDIVQWVAIPALVVALIYAGFILVSAGGNEAEITKGKLWLLSTAIGAAIVLGARVIANIVFGTASVF